MLPIISRVIKKVIQNQISGFLNSKIFLYTCQSGFRKNHSTDFCLSYLNGKILKGFDKGLMTGMILIDLQKAFETIDQDILLQKVPQTSILRQLLFLIYVNDMSQAIKCNICLVCQYKNINKTENQLN